MHGIREHVTGQEVGTVVALRMWMVCPISLREMDGVSQ